MNWLRQFMTGRRGADLLTFVLLLIAVIFSRIAAHTHLLILYIIFYGVFAFSIYRFFSRNISQRAAENEAFLRLVRPIGQWFLAAQSRRQDKQYHCFFKCPKCKERLRVPRGKGKILITCPKCGTQFTKMT